MDRMIVLFCFLVFSSLLLWSEVIQLDGIDDHVHYFNYNYDISDNLTVETWVKGSSPNGVVASVWNTISDQRSWRLFASGTKISASVSLDGTFVNAFSLTSNSDVFGFFGIFRGLIFKSSSE